MTTLNDITINESWACKFKATCWVDKNNKPVKSKPNVGEPHKGKPGIYESIGIIKVRDVENKKVQLIDVETKQEFIVSWDSCWDIDTVEWV